MPDTPKPRWTYTPPEGFRPKMERLLSQRYHGPAEIWAEVRDWLEANGVERPEHVTIEGQRGHLSGRPEARKQTSRAGRGLKPAD